MGILSILMSFVGTSPAKGAIHVEFIDAKDKSVVGVSNMAPEQLPDTFLVDTTFTIKGKKWSVVTAEPVDKPEFIKTGKLKVMLSAIGHMSPSEILFSLPTISDDVGGVTGNDTPNELIFSIHEDDWRQVEFISAKFKPEITKECVDIRKIYANERKGVGFEKVHVRKRIPKPFDGVGLSLADLEKALLPSAKFKAIGFQRTRGTIPASFAWKLAPQLTVWGVTDEKGNVARLCVSGAAEASSVNGLSEVLASFTVKYKLTFVNWVQCAEINNDAKAFAAYFQKP